MPDPDAKPTGGGSGGGGGGGGLWAIPLMCLGLGLAACCVLVPAAEVSRALFAQRAELGREVDRLAGQARRNEEFLARLGRDAELGAVVAERQLGRLPAGVGELPLSVAPAGFDASPFAMLQAPDAPPPVRPTRLPGGRLTRWLLDARLNGWLLGGSLLAAAAGLILGRE